MTYDWIIKTVLAQGGQVTSPSSGGGQVTSPSGGEVLTNPISVNSISELIYKLLDIIVQVGLPLIVVAFVITGFLYVTARGDTSKVKRAHVAFLYTVVGAALILGAAVIAKAIEGTIKGL